MEQREDMDVFDTIAEQFVLADVTDPHGLAELHTTFQRAASWAESNSMSGLHGALESAATLLERIILAEVENPADRLVELGPLVEALSQFARTGDPPHTWPAPDPGANCSDHAPSSAPSDDTQQAGGAVQFDADLLADFIGEAREHLEAADTHLLTLETVRDDTEALNAVFRSFHTIKGGAGFLQLTDILHVAHEAETLLDKARRNELVLSSHVMDTVFAAVDLLRLLVNRLPANARGDEGMAVRIEDTVQEILAAAAGDAGDESDAAAAPMKLGEVLVGKRVVTHADIDAALVQQQNQQPGEPLGNILVKQGKVPAQKVAEALRQQQRETPQVETTREAIKVDAERLDRLVNLMGELVVAQAMVRQTVEDDGVVDAHTRHSMAQLDKITRELQEISMSLRMVPLRSTFQKMARMVRDLAKKSRKPIDFVLRGEDTELDKSVVDLIGDPLMHMLRNSVDHGVEKTNEERRAAGKSEQGRIELRAFHRGGSIFIEIEDDGRGLQRDAILAKARERGLIEPDAVLSDREVWNLIFVPGFSTAQTITDVSGRGVGMDVVKRNIRALRGQIEVQSEPGKGTIISVRLPLTLAIIDGMVLRVDDECYIVPTQSIVMAIRPEDHHLSTVTGRGEMVNLHGELIPLFRLHRLLQSSHMPADSMAIALVVESDGKRVALFADELLGQQQIVIKSLGEGLRGITGFAGGAIMADGSVGLILDVAGVVQLAQTTDNGSYREVEAPETQFATI